MILLGSPHPRARQRARCNDNNLTRTRTVAQDEPPPLEQQVATDDEILNHSSSSLSSDHCSQGRWRFLPPEAACVAACVPPIPCNFRRGYDMGLSWSSNAALCDSGPPGGAGGSESILPAGVVLPPPETAGQVGILSWVVRFNQSH
jgi:hypothetical protein